MSIGPTTFFGKERVFVDREDCIQAFRENIRNSGTREFNILFYYGIAGIGKSKLQKELQVILNEEYPEIVWAAIDPSTKNYREVNTFLITLRNKIQEKCKAKFYLFNTAHAIYWKKLHPEIPLRKDNYPLIKEEGFFSKIIDVLNEIRPGPLQLIPIRLIFDIVNNAPDDVKIFFKEQAIDIDILADMEAYEIEKLLPGFFAVDLTSYLGTNSKAYIFIDTYEVLWEGLKNKGSFHEKEEWIRDDLIPNIQRVSWVICGREKLLWVSECDPDWRIFLEQHSVNGLPEKYCTEFLEDCGIENKDIQDIIIKASNGVPYYLNLSVDTFEKIIKKRKPISEDFAKTQPEIFHIFVKHLDRNEIQALEVLSAPNFWDRNLFEILMKKFDPGLPIGAFSEMIKFSFIKTDTDGRCSIHQLMKKSLQEHQECQDPIYRKKIHLFLLDYYCKKMEDIDIKSITSEHEIALNEAFYHAKEVLGTEDLLNWFIATSGPFNRELITPMYEEMLQILEAKIGPENPDVATILNILAGLYRQMGDYEKALPLYKRALEIVENVLDPQHPSVATTLNNLAGLYCQMGDYEKALPLYKRALEISENVLGPQHPSVATTLNNLASLYYQMGDYEQALPLLKRALDISENVLGPEHPEVATTLNNLAGLYKSMGDYERALPLYKKALEISENVLGSEHPEVATTQNNLASLYYQMRDYEKALPLYKSALDIREKVLGPQHPSVATTLNNLASLYESMGDYEKALPLYMRDLEISKKVLGPEHPSVATTLNNLAALYKSIGEYEKALKYSERSFQIYEKVFGSEHPEVAYSLNNLASLYESVGEYKKSLKLLKSAFSILESKLGKNNPNSLVVKKNLESIIKKMQRN